MTGYRCAAQGHPPRSPGRDLREGVGRHREGILDDVPDLGCPRVGNSYLWMEGGEEGLDSGIARRGSTRDVRRGARRM